MKPESPAPHTAHAPIRDLQRLAQILQVVVKYGGRHYVEQLRLKTYLSKEAKEAITPKKADVERLRMALEELGPSFIKFGQMLSTRQDLFSPEMIKELQKLQDEVPSFPGQQAREIIEQELGQPVARLFKDFVDTPLAAASMAQVHSATRHDGTAVIVKVQRPEIERQIHTDLEILFFIAGALIKHVPSSVQYDPVGLVEEFSRTILHELDFRREGHNADRFREQFAAEPSVYVPKIFWELTGRRVLTMEQSKGRKISPDYPLPEHRAKVAHALVQMFLSQVLEYGFFHGDPHPGNVFIMDEDRLCFHDFGIMGVVAPRDQESLRQLFLALVVRDAEWMANVYLDMGGGVLGVERAAFARDLSVSLEDYFAVAAKAYSFGEILNQFIHLGRRHRIKVLREFLLISKCFMALESTVRLLDPQMDMVAALKAYLPRLLGKQLLPSLQPMQSLASTYRLYAALREILVTLPESLGAGMRKLNQGEWAFKVHHEELPSFEQHLDRASNRLSFALIIAAIVIGSSIIMSSEAGPHYKGVPFLGLLGYVLAAILGLWWIVAILRSGKL